MMHSAAEAVAAIGLCFADLFAGMFFLLLIAWEIIMAAFSVCSAVVAASLFGGFSPWSLIPPIPYGCGVIFGLSLSGLAVLSAVSSKMLSFIGKIIPRSWVASAIYWRWNHAQSKWLTLHVAGPNDS